jgi:hypothetical protein
MIEKRLRNARPFSFPNRAATKKAAPDRSGFEQ